MSWRTGPEVIILGGGPAGLAAADAVVEAGPGVPLVVEQEAVCGGLARTETWDGLSYDLGSHRFHQGMGSPERAWLADLLGPDLMTRPRRGGIYFHGQWLSYPLRMSETWKLGPGRIARWLGGYAQARLGRRTGGETGDCRQAFVRAFGRPMVDEFYAPYLHKVFGLDLSEMSPEQYRRRVSSRSLAGVVRRVLGGGGKEGRPGATYLYPRGGIGQPFEVMARGLIGRGGQVWTGHRVTRVTHHAGRVTAARVERGEEAIDLEVAAAVSTIPLPGLISILDPPPPAEVTRAAAALRYRDLVIVLVRFGGPRPRPRESFYFPTADVPFNRVFVPANFTGRPAEGDFLVGFEFGAFAGEGLWSRTEDELWALVRPWTERLGLGDAARMKAVLVRRLTHSYPLYELGFEDHLRTVLDWLDGLDNLITTGRQGLFVHNNMHHSLEMGRLAGQAVLAGGPHSAVWRAARELFAAYQIVD